MSENRFTWTEIIDGLGMPYRVSSTVAPVGVPVPIEHPCPPELRMPLQAVLRQAFLLGNREAPLVDGLMDIAGWEHTEPSLERRAPRVQVVVPVRGAHEALRLCLECLDAHGTGDMATANITIAAAEAEREAILAVTRKRQPGPWLEVATTPEPQAFAANVNLGASRSRSEFVVLLNSDAYVGPGWLDKLLAPFADPEVVAVGPMGTNVSGHQGTVAYVPSLDLAAPELATEVAQSVADWAHRRATERSSAGRVWPEPWYDARRLVGFCVAVRRSAWDRIGGMDERFTNAYCDDDLTLRLSLVGKCVVVPDLLVLHDGQRSFAELPDAAQAFNKAMHDNAGRFADKWRWIYRDWAAWCDARGWR